MGVHALKQGVEGGNPIGVESCAREEFTEKFTEKFTENAMVPASSFVAGLSAGAALDVADLQTGYEKCDDFCESETMMKDGKTYRLTARGHGQGGRGGAQGKFCSEMNNPNYCTRTNCHCYLDLANEVPEPPPEYNCCGVQGTVKCIKGAKTQVTQAKCNEAATDFNKCVNMGCFPQNGIVANICVKAAPGGCALTRRLSASDCESHECDCTDDPDRQCRRE